MNLRAVSLVPLLAASLLAQVDPQGRSILFIRGADGSGGLGGGSTQRRTEHLSDINNTSTNPGNHGFGELAALLRAEGMTVSQWIESNGTLTAQRLAPHRLVVFGSNNRTYSATEVAAFHSWVDSGGSALFISDANWGSNFDVAPQSDNQFMARYGLAMYQDSADGVPVLSRATPNRYRVPAHPILSGFNGVGGTDDVQNYDGEGVSYLSLGQPPSGWTNRGLVSASGFRVRLTTGNGSAGGTRPAGPNDFALVLAERGDSVIAGHFDRNTFFNRNGTGSNLFIRDNRRFAINLFRYLVSVPATFQLEGVACSNRASPPTLTVTRPELDRPWDWRVSGPANAPVLFLFSGPRSVPPFSLGRCFVYTDIATLEAIPLTSTNGSGTAALRADLPAVLALSGQRAVTQAAFLVTGGPVGGQLELTAGVQLRFGVAR